MSDNEDSYECSFQGVIVPHRASGMWGIECKLDNGEIKTIWGDWRPIKNLADGLRKGQRLRVWNIDGEDRVEILD